MISNPKGIDYPIQDMQNLFKALLWTDNNCQFYHRVFRNERSGNVIPEVFIESTNDYKPVKFDDNYDAISWFDVSNIGSSISSSLFKQDVGIFFAVNLKKIYPTLTHRAVEESHIDAINVISKRQSFSITELITGSGAYGDFSITDLKAYDRHPWHVFRINTLLSYTFKC